MTTRPEIGSFPDGAHKGLRHSYDPHHERDVLFSAPAEDKPSHAHHPLMQNSVYWYGERRVRPVDASFREELLHLHESCPPSAKTLAQLLQCEEIATLSQKVESCFEATEKVGVQHT